MAILDREGAEIIFLGSDDVADCTMKLVALRWLSTSHV